MSEDREPRADLPGDAGMEHTPLHALHVDRGAKMVAFAGYEMPLQYPTGVIKEHLHTRAAAGLLIHGAVGRGTSKTATSNVGCEAKTSPYFSAAPS